MLQSAPSQTGVSPNYITQKTQTSSLQHLDFPFPIAPLTSYQYSGAPSPVTGAETRGTSHISLFFCFPVTSHAQSFPHRTKANMHGA